MNLNTQDARPEESYRLIPLTKGQFTIVDTKDYKRLSQWKWTADWDNKGNKFYAVRRVTINKRSIKIRMHRLILGLQYGDPLHSDHRNGNSLDNRRSNLRACTQASNNKNARKRKDNTSGLKGVDFHDTHWRARINRDGVPIYIGSFRTKEDAYIAYCEAAKRLHGEFAHLG